MGFSPGAAGYTNSRIAFGHEFTGCGKVLACKDLYKASCPVGAPRGMKIRKKLSTESKELSSNFHGRARVGPKELVKLSLRAFSPRNFMKVAHVLRTGRCFFATPSRTEKKG